MTKQVETTEVLRRYFTDVERLQFGSELAGAYNRLAEVEDEEAVMKSQIKERKAQIEATVGSLSRRIADGYMMENVRCKAVYGQPNALEVSIVRIDNGETVKVRPMTEGERQQELPLDQPANEAAAEASAEESAANVIEFFKPPTNEAVAEGILPDNVDPTGEAVEQEEELTTDEQFLVSIPKESSLFTDPDPAASAEAIKPEHDAEFDGIPAPSPDEVFAQAVRLTVEGGRCSTAVLQRELGVGYARAAQLINLMEANGIVGPGDGSGKREVLKDKAWLAEVIAEDRHPADEVIAPKGSTGTAGTSSIADDHKARVAKTFKPKALREQGFKGEEPKKPEQW